MHLATPGVRKDMVANLKAELPAQLPAYLKGQRWFGAKAREIRATQVADVISLQREALNAVVVLARVEYEGGGADLYALPLVGQEAGAAGSGEDSAAVLKVAGRASGESIVFADALKEERFLVLLLDAIQRGLIFTGESGELRTANTHALSLQETGAAGSLHPRAISGEQSNSSIAYGERLMLKFVRRLEEGVNPDLEMTSFLTEKAGYSHTPQLLGSLEYWTAQGTRMTQGILQTFVPNQGDAWKYTMRAISGFYHEVPTVAPSIDGLAAIPHVARAQVDNFLESVALLARRTAELHLALAAAPAGEYADFAPEAYDAKFQEGFEQALQELTRRTFSQLRKGAERMREELRAEALLILAEEQKITTRFHASLAQPIRAMRTRIHGDFHLGQVLYTGADFFIIDFEGEPARPMSQRRLKRSPLQDVAGMVRSFHYAAYAPLLAATGEVRVDEASRGNLHAWAQVWSKIVAERYLAEYLRVAAGAAFLPPTRAEVLSLLQLHLLEKAVYELGYELNNRPDWVAIPLEGILEILQETTGKESR
jgi:trehalose synthase-fused probable maltokinase